MNAAPIVNSLGEPFRVVDMEETIYEVLAMLQWQADRLRDAAEMEDGNDPVEVGARLGALNIAEKLRERLHTEWTAAVDTARLEPAPPARAGKGGAHEE